MKCLLPIGTSLLLVMTASLNVHAGEVFKVTPSGGNDTASIQAAFDAASSAGPGSVVKFKKGTFHISSPIIVKGFSGVWKGAGKNKTIIEVQGDPSRPCFDRYGAIPSIQFGCFPHVDYTVDDSPPLVSLAVFRFLQVMGGPPVELKVSKLSINLRGVTDVYYIHGIPAPNNAYLFAFHLSGDRFWEYDGVVQKVGFSMDRVAINTQPGAVVLGEESLLNLFTHIEFQGGTDGFNAFPDDYEVRKAEPVETDIKIHRSEFGSAGVGVNVLPIDSLIEIGGSNSKGNLFDSVLTAARIRDPSRSRIDFSHNYGSVQLGSYVGSGIQNAFGFDDGPQDVPLPELSEVNISCNDFEIGQVFGASAGVYTEDFVYGFLGVKTQDVVIYQNKFHGITDSLLSPGWGGVDILTGKDAIVVKNEITGRFNVGGITVGYCCHGYPFAADDLLIIGNTGQTVDGGSPWYEYVGQIWLGENSSGSTVIDAGADIFDEGVNNSVIAGASEDTIEDYLDDLEDILGDDCEDDDDDSEDGD